MAKPRPKTKSEEPAPATTATIAGTAGTAGTAPKTAKPAGNPPAVYDEPALDAFGAGLQALHQKNWAKAAEMFESTLAQSDRSDISARARQFLTTARQHLPEKAAGTAKGGEDGDPFLQAVFEKNRGNFTAALDLCRKEGREQKDERFAYLAAAVLAAEGRIEEAAQALSRAIELNPKNRVHAYHDSDFAEIRKDRDHRQLFGLS